MHQTKFKGIIFDMDGTLTVPTLNFRKIREELNIPDGDIAEIINSWEEPRRRMGWQTIERYETVASSNIQLQPDAAATLLNLAENGIRLAIITRNTMRSVQAFLPTVPVCFDPILTREFPFLKPAPEPVWHILECWEMAAELCLMVGDFIHDLESANAAGVYSCYFQNPDCTDYSHAADFTITSYHELRKLALNEIE